MTLTELSVSLSQKIDDPVVENINGRIVTSDERKNYLQKAYGYLFAFLSSIQNDAEIIKTFPYVFKVYFAGKYETIDVTSEVVFSVYYDKTPLTYIEPNKLLEAVATGNKKNYWYIMNNKFVAIYNGSDVTGKVNVVTKTEAPDFSKVNELEQYYSDLVILLAARECAMDIHNNDRFMALSQLVKEWHELEIAKVRMGKQNG